MTKPLTTLKPGDAFGAAEAAALATLGYVYERIEADWRDVGGPESGPQIVGNPAADAWILNGATKNSEHQVIVVDEVIDYVGFEGNDPHFDQVFTPDTCSWDRD